jgi:transcriptional regulator with XRE-family HTH domain
MLARCRKGVGESLHHVERGGESLKVSELVGDNIRVLRRAAGLTQAELAEAMEAMGFRWVRQTVAETESGRRDAKVEELVALAAYFEMPVRALLGTPGGAPTRDAVAEGLDVGGRTIPFRDWVMLTMDARSPMESASRPVRRAIDFFTGQLPRLWARSWRREGGPPGSHYIAAREARLEARTKLPGPIFVWEGEGDLQTYAAVRPWGADVRVKLKHGVPYVARDEAEAERLLETMAVQPQLRVITRQEAYRLRKSKVGRGA